MFFLLPLVFSCRSAPPVEEGEELFYEDIIDDVAEYPDPADEYAGDEYGEELYELAPEEYDPTAEVPSEAPAEIPAEIPVDEESLEEEPAAIADTDPDLEEPALPGVVFLPPLPWAELPLQNFPLELDLPEDLPEPQVETPPTALPEPQPVEPPPPPQQIPPPAPPPPPAVVTPPDPPAVAPPLPPPFLRPPEQEVPPLVPPPDQPLPELPARPDIAEDEIIFSRVVRVTVGQIIEIPFRGTGWVYLGELANRRGIAYDSRRLDTVAGTVIGQSFIFRAEAVGTYILRFFRQDFIRDYILNDHVQIIVGEAPDAFTFGQPRVDQGRVIAEPRWPPPAGEQWLPPVAEPMPEPLTEPEAADPAIPAIPPADAIAPDALPLAAIPPAALAPVPPAIVPPPPAPLGDSPADYVRRAREEFDAGRVEPALAILDTMRLRFPSGSDEAWFLYGQLLEANSPSRDIRRALEFYHRLINEYPQSHRVQEALRRVAHLERFFFHIR